MAEATTATQELAQQQAQEKEEKQSRVHFFDPDFLLIILPFALLVDSLDIILELTSFLIIPKLVGLVIDFVTMFIIGGWMYWRVGKILKSKKRRQAIGRKTGRGISRALMRGPLRKIIMRLGLVVFIEAIPVVGILFAWTVAVVLTLREK
jgi:hypothetical protein